MIGFPVDDKDMLITSVEEPKRVVTGDENKALTCSSRAVDEEDLEEPVGASDSSDDNSSDDEQSEVNLSTTRAESEAENETSKSYPHSEEENRGESSDSRMSDKDADGAISSDKEKANENSDTNQQTAVGAESDDDMDSDEEVFRNRKKRLKMNRSLLDDSDDDIGNDGRMRNSPSVVDQESGDEKSGDESDLALSQKKGSRLKKILDDSDDDDDDNETSCSKEASQSGHDTKTATTMRSDIFDAEMDDDDDSSKSGDSDNDEKAGQEDEDDGFVAPKSGRWAKGKGASKSTPKEREHREKAVQAQQIHSESQRMTREAQVKLPYHQPKPLNLQDILNRRNQKQTTPLQLRPTPSLIRQMSLDSPSAKKKPSVILPTFDDKEDRSMDDNENISDETGVDVVDGKNVEDVKESIDNDVDDDDDLDHLPDLYVESMPMEPKSKHSSPKGSEKTEDAGNRNVNTLTDDSGFVTTPFSSSDDESNGVKKADDISLKETMCVDEPMDLLPNIVHQGCGDAESSQVIQKSSKTMSSFIQKKSDMDNNEDEVLSKDLEFDVLDGGPSSAKKIRPTLDLLANLDLPSLNPKLDNGGGDFIDLDMEEDSVPVTGVQGLMSRFIQHTKKISPKGPKKIEVSFVHKDLDESEKEVLKLGKISYELEAEQSIDPKLLVPGAKLQFLKEKLRGGMKAKREEARLKKLEAYAFDNEEGFVGEEEDEAELTDQTDTDVEEEPDEEEEMEEEVEEEDEKEKEALPYADDEAEDDDDFADEDTMHLQLNSSDSEHTDDENENLENGRKGFLKSAKEKTQRQDSRTGEEDNLLKTPTLGGSDSVSSDTLKDNFLIPSAKRNRIPSDRSTQDMFTPFSKVSNTSNSTDSTGKSKGFCSNKSSGLTLPIEDTQDLYQSDMSNSMCGNAKQETPKNSSFHYDESQMFDENGFLKVNKSTGKKYIKRQLHLGDDDDKDKEDDMGELLGLCSGKFPGAAVDQYQDDMNELLGLCSGRFPSATQATETTQKKKLTMKGLFPQEPTSTQANMDELMGLCSGKFQSDSMPLAKNLPMSSQFGNTQSNVDELLGLCSGKFSLGNSQFAKKLPMSSDIGNTQSNEDELMGLCSGKFPNSNTQSESNKRRGSFSQFGNTQSNMDELVGLCSGKFPSSNAQSTKTKLSLLSDDDSDDGDDLQLQVLSGDEDDDEEEVNGRKKHAATLDSDEEVDNDRDEEDNEADGDDNDEEEVEEEQHFSFKGFTKQGKIRKEFMEGEAELSGSEYDSDENLDLDEKDDIMEVEEGDKDDVGTEEDLRDQVGRVHLKSVIDEDKKELRMFQEMYLPDGDLHTEGEGRQRKFRWKNVDDDTQQDMFDDNSDNEQNADDDAEHESKWRMERFARERWLEEQKANTEVENQEGDSQLMKFGNVVLKKMNGGLAMEKLKPASQPTENKAPSTPKSLFRMKQRRGSFLTRSKETLAVIAERTKPVSNPVAPVNSRGFVFSAISPEKKKNMPVKRANSVNENQPSSKRPKLERSNTFSGNSIFKLMDH
ncbi:claspin-like [Lineus longissimus]|uniref:claspin-like n=1 Tax=Lineus longissimus TaxID=88925 RepID=UPI00315D4DD1